MRRLIAAAGLGCVIAWLALPGSPALACTCDALPVHAQIQTADAVFTGTVTAMSGDASEQVVTMHVDRVYKGEPPAIVDVHSASSPDACGIQFGREASYLVFARSAAGAYTTSLCAGTTDDLGAAERAGASGHEVLASSVDTTIPAKTEHSRAMPIALAGITLASVFAVHARRFAKLT